MIKYGQKRISADEWREVAKRVKNDLICEGLLMTPRTEGIVLATLERTREQLMKKKVVRFDPEENKKEVQSYCVKLLDIIKYIEEVKEC